MANVLDNILNALPIEMGDTVAVISRCPSSFRKFNCTKEPSRTPLKFSCLVNVDMLEALFYNIVEVMCA